MARFSSSSGGGEGTVGPAGPAGPAGANGANGLDGEGFNFRGEWVTDTLYLENDVVTQNGSTYIANYDYQDTSGPYLDGDLWAALALKGTDGADGTDALWNFTGEYSGGASYAVGDIATYNGELWYRYNSNGGNVGDTPSPGLWNLLAAKGADGANGSDGAAGDPGPQGDPGAPGADGSQGPQGDPGSPGLVYLGNYISGNGYIANIAVVKGSDNNLYIATSSGGLGDPVGNTAEWAIFLPKGADGAQGEPGTPGADGADGADGASGTSGLETSTRYSPVFTATGLAFTGSGATYPTYNSYYVKAGKLVSFVIEVDMSTVTNFGTGQYKLQLPFTPQFGFNHFSGWCWADPDVDPDTGTGHTIINADTAGVTDVLDLHYLKSAGGANAPIREGLFLQGTPVTLTTISKIYINGTYIAAS
jgi:hypothetical protein